MQATTNGVFTTVLVRDGRPHHLRLHLARLGESARITGLPEVGAHDAEAQVRAAIAAAEAATTASARLRIGWNGTLVTTSLAPFAGHPPTTTVLRSVETRQPDAATAGAKTDALGEQGRRLLVWAGAHGAGEALLATPEGLLAEGSTSNVFYVLEGELRTPTTATGLLGGIARHLVLAATGAREVDAAYDVLLEASEVFLTSSLRGVQPVTAVDGRDLGQPGPATLAALRAWTALPVDD